MAGQRRRSLDESPKAPDPMTHHRTATFSFLLYAMAILVCLAAPTAPAHGDDAVVPILGWRTLSENELTLERFQEMKEMGLTHSLMSYSPEGNAKALDLGQQVGIKLFISDGRFAEGGDALRQAVQSYREHPALAGYNLRDEPSLS